MPNRVHTMAAVHPLAEAPVGSGIGGLRPEAGLLAAPESWAWNAAVVGHRMSPATRNGRPRRRREAHAERSNAAPQDFRLAPAGRSAIDPEAGVRTLRQVPTPPATTPIAPTTRTWTARRRLISLAI